jgi:hypothetical protein
MQNADKLDGVSKAYAAKYNRQRQFSFPPPTLNTQLPFKLEEENDDEEEEEEENSNQSSDSNSFEVIR